jgi:hypothetical protein
MATVADVLASLTASNDGITAARAFIKSNPTGGATQAQLDQIFAAAKVVETNVGGLQTDLGMPTPAPVPNPTPTGSTLPPKL